MVNYVFTTAGELFICRALKTCSQFGVTWEQLWSDARSKEAEAARQFLEFDLKTHDTETGKLLGAAAVIQMLHSVVSEPSSLEATSKLLDHAHLLTEANIAVAADAMGLSLEHVRSVLSPER
jgi:hypothetical protein